MEEGVCTLLIVYDWCKHLLGNFHRYIEPNLLYYIFFKTNICNFWPSHQYFPKPLLRLTVCAAVLENCAHMHTSSITIQKVTRTNEYKHKLYSLHLIKPEQVPNLLGNIRLSRSHTLRPGYRNIILYIYSYGTLKWDIWCEPGTIWGICSWNLIN